MGLAMLQYFDRASGDLPHTVMSLYFASRCHPISGNTSILNW